MIDIHCHILPSVDDGAENIHETVEMLKLSQKDGTRHIIATPHFMDGRFEIPFQEIKNRVCTVNDEIKKMGLDIRIYPGQEIMLSYNTVKAYKEGIIGGLNGGKFILLEMKGVEFDPGLLEVLYELKLMGLTPIIAHPERYRFILEDIDLIDMFVEEGCLFQLNAGSINGDFGKRIRRCARELLDCGIYDFIGSDAHSSTRRIPNMKSIVQNQRNKRKNKLIGLIKNNENLLRNKFIPSKKEKIQIKSPFQKLFGF